MTEAIDRVRLARLPTPVQRLSRLSAALGTEVWVKRDDLTGLGLSGNKVRKLDLLVAEAEALGADTLLTTGGIQSNHCRATAVAARQRGLDVRLLLRGARPPVPDGNLLLDDLLGAPVRWCTPEDYRARRDAILEEMADQVRAAGGVPYVIPEGGSNGLGALAYRAAAHELLAQEAPDFSEVVVAVGSGGTLAGLTWGGLPGRVTGMAVCDDAAYFEARVAAMATQARARTAVDTPEPGDGWRVLDAYKGPTYGVATPEVLDVIRRVARLEGLFLDPVYTGKAMWGLIREVQAGRMRGPVLFWHTGGAFGLFGRGAELVGA